MNNLLNLDGELKMQHKPRWQRKMETSNASISKLSISYNNSYSAAMNTTATGNKTPNKSVVEAKKKTPSDKRSPGRL